MRKLLILTGIFCVISGSLFSANYPRPDEGMWLPLYIKQLNEKRMIELGLKLTADDIYNINKASLKDAVLRLGTGFCTGELVSDKGLVFTNHHCGYDAIASLSSVENDFLTNGFWANTMDKEIPIPDFTVSRLVYMQDLTALIKSETKDMDETTKAKRIEAICDSVIAASTRDTHYEAEVKEMFNGLEHYLMVYETFKDVRFVGAPPSSIGKFGGDTDNWMWPRHTGDFSILRVYTGPDGKPAEYSKENIPYKPIKFFEISLAGVQKNDYAMIMGYPGTTERYLTSFDINYKQNLELPALVDIFGEILSNWKIAMDADPQTRLDLASDYASTANSHKYFKGQMLGLKRYGLINQYKAQEEEFTKWVNADPDRKIKYGTALSDIEDLYSKYNSIMPGFYYLAAGILRLDITTHFSNANQLQGELAEKRPGTEEVAALKETATKLFKNQNLTLDKQALRYFLLKFYNSLSDPNTFSIFKDIETNYKGTDFEAKLDQYLTKMYTSSVLLDKTKFDKFIIKPSPKVLSKDMGVALINELYGFMRSNYLMPYFNYTGNVDALHAKYMEALREWKKDKVFYPDANSTLRLTYGKVLPYIPRDAVFYNYYTTHYGILQKENPKDEEFVVHEKLIKLLNAKDFGRYGVKDTLYTCFLTDNDITGGNSGSPVLNAKGQLIGIAFDGNWESMTGDLVVDPKYNRTINVDIRYVLFVIDKFAGANNLIAELKISE